MKILVGNTGLIGTTLKKSIKFDFEFNSKNINTFIDLIPNDQELYLSCLPATKWLVNQKLDDDIKNMIDIINILKTKKYSKILLISTIDVYNDSPLKVNETYKPNVGNLSYGNNRYFFELLVKNHLKTNDLKIFRVPGLFSEDIKKNILYDLINKNNINLINTNSIYQWYNLNLLFDNINFFCEKHPNETTINLFPEPIHTYEILNLFPDIDVKNLKNDKLIIYDYTTKFGTYLYNKKTILNDIKQLINEISVK
jgi:hypothetical protein